MTTETKEVKTPEIKPEVRTMSDIIYREFTVDKKEGKISKSDDIFEKTLPEDLTMEQVNKVGAHLKTFVPASAHAFGRASFELMKGNKSVDKVETTITLGKDDKIILTTDRKTITHPPGEPTKDVVHHNRVHIDLKIRAGKSESQLKAVREELNQLAMAGLTK